MFRKRIVVSTVVIALTVYLGICAYFYAFQRSLLYYPTAGVAGVGLEHLSVTSGEHTLRVWRTADDRAKAVLYFGGNAETVALSADLYQRFFPDFTLYLLDYRGYGHSTGTPSEGALLDDAVAVYDALASRHENMVVVGRSLGTGVATHVAANRTAAGLILITPYDSIAAVARHHFPWLPVPWLLKDRFESHAWAAKVTAPTLIVAAEDDRVIPIRHSEQLAEAFTQAPLTYVQIDRSDHITVSEAESFAAALKDFVTAR